MLAQSLNAGRNVADALCGPGSLWTHPGPANISHAPRPLPGVLTLHVKPKEESMRRIMADPPPPPPPMRVGITRPDRIKLLDGPLKNTEAELLQSRDGSTWLRLGLRLHRRLD